MKKICLLLLALCSTLAHAQTLPPYVPAAGLLAWYPFTGNAIDSSGNGHDGVVTTATLTTDRFGNANSAYLFNGTTSNINTTLLPPTGNNARTISCWFQYDSLPAPCATGLAIAGYGASTQQCWQVAQNFSLEVAYSGYPPAARVDGVCVYTQDVDSVNNDWHFFAATYDTAMGLNFDSIKIYVDGAFVTTTTVAYSGPSDVNTGDTTTFQIGVGHYECPRYFNGKIDDIGVWNRALSATELNALYRYHSWSTSVGEVNNYETVKISPNPATGTVVVTSSVRINKIDLKDIWGRTVLSETADNVTATIDVSKLAGGLYFVRINDAFTQKLVKQ